MNHFSLNCVLLVAAAMAAEAFAAPRIYTGGHADISTRGFDVVVPEPTCLAITCVT